MRKCKEAPMACSVLSASLLLRFLVRILMTTIHSLPIGIPVLIKKIQLYLTNPISVPSPPQTLDHRGKVRAGGQRRRHLIGLYAAASTLETTASDYIGEGMHICRLHCKHSLHDPEDRTQ